MWMSTEVWDDEARMSIQQIRKGSPIAGIGYLIFNRWTDKNTGEERKQFKLRITKLMGSDVMSEMLEPLMLDEIIGTGNMGNMEDNFDSNFSNQHQDDGVDQTISQENTFENLKSTFNQGFRAPPPQSAPANTGYRQPAPSAPTPAQPAPQWGDMDTFSHGNNENGQVSDSGNASDSDEPEPFIDPRKDPRSIPF
jgi:single-stranded DNA-binding protein